MRNHRWPRIFESTLLSAIVGGAIPGLLLLLYQYWVPFQPSGTPGTVGFKVQRAPFPLLAIVAPMTFQNNGARPGCFADVALEVFAETSKTKWDLFPVFFLDYASLLRERNKDLKKDLSNFIESTFFPLPVGGRQQLSKTVVFMPRPPATLGVHRFSADELSPDETYTYRFLFVSGSLNCNVDREAKYKPLAERSFKMSKEQLAFLKGGDLVNLPDETLDRVRENLISK